MHSGYNLLDCAKKLDLSVFFCDRAAVATRWKDQLSFVHQLTWLCLTQFVNGKERVRRVVDILSPLLLLLLLLLRLLLLLLFLLLLLLLLLILLFSIRRPLGPGGGRGHSGGDRRAVRASKSKRLRKSGGNDILTINWTLDACLKWNFLIIGIQYLLAPSFPVLSIDVIVNNFSEWQTTLIEDVICATLMDFEACCWQQTFGRTGKLFAGENVVWKRTREEFSIAVKVKVMKVPKIFASCEGTFDHHMLEMEVVMNINLFLSIWNVLFSVVLLKKWF